MLSRTRAWQIELRLWFTLSALLLSASCRSEHSNQVSFGAAVTPEFVLGQIRQMIDLEALAMAPPETQSPAGYTFILPTDDTSYVVTVDFPPHDSASWAEQADAVADATNRSFLDASCMKRFRHLPFSAGPGGSFRAVEFTTWDSRHDVKIAVFEKLRDPESSQTLELDRLAEALSKQYCSANGYPSTTSGSEQ